MSSKRKPETPPSGASPSLKRSRSELPDVFMDHAAMMLVIDPASGRIVAANDAADRYYGWPHERLLEMRIHDINTLSYADVEKEMAQAQTGEKVRFEFRHCRADGSIRDVEVFSSKIAMGMRGELLHSIIHDITDRKEAEEALRASELQYRFLTERMNDVIWTASLRDKLTLTYVSPSIEKLLGFTPAEWLQREIDEMVSPASRAVIVEVIAREIALERDGSDPLRTLTLELEYYHRNGSTRWFEHVINGVRDGEGVLTAIHGVGREITQRRAADAAIREQEERFRMITNNSQDVIWMLDNNLSITYISPAIEQLVGYPRDEYLAKPHTDIIAPPYYEVLMKALAEELEIEKLPEKDLLRSRTIEVEQIRKGGKRIWVEMKISSIRDEENNMIGLLGFSRDITERKKMEEELVRSYKLESLGVLAGGIAHDFNNLMAIVQGYIDLALMDLPPGHVSVSRLQAASQSLAQTKELTGRLITFSRGGHPHLGDVDVEELLRDTVNRTLKDTVQRAKISIPKDLWPVKADEVQLKQVFYNLTTNAMEAMPTGGMLRITAANECVTTDIVPELKEGVYLKIVFADEGAGIPADLLLKVFDPYFTTKDMGARKGLGLGLAVSYSVVKKHGGHITVQSEPGRGSSFTIYLPAQSERGEGGTGVETVSGGPVRVLIMDDEEHIREILRAYLERWGYAVTDASDGREAVKRYVTAREAGAPFGLVFLDLTVRRGLGGREAMVELLKVDPAARVVIASGYLDDPVMENYAAYGFLGALKKPFTGEELKNMVESLLPAGGS